MNSEIKKENDRKKQFLWSYQDSAREIRRLELKLSEIRQMRIIPAIISDGMPHGSGGIGDLSGYAALLDELERKYLKARYKRVRQFKTVTSRIEQVKDQREREVLMYRYIKNLGWTEIGNIMHYSTHHVLKIHGSALKNFKMDTQ